ncbi:MAG: cupin domain-containing protein [Burkholderiaceae bacterium]|nr:cupin domain-containing protein [Burkholderiaceae bacterium]
MHLVRQSQAPVYTAPGHAGMTMHYLQGRDAGPSGSVWIGRSVIAPGGGTTLVASGVEKFYVLIEGRLEVTSALEGRQQTETLLPMDSCRIAPGEARQLSNRGTEPATVLLIMPIT